MPGWLIFILVALLLLIGVVALLLLLPDTEATEGGSEQSGQVDVLPQATPPATLPPQVVAHPQTVAAPSAGRRPPIMLRPRPASGPKLTIGGRARPPAEEFRPTPPADNGTKMKLGQVKINLNAICRRTGRRIRVCSCERCGKEREQFGV